MEDHARAAVGIEARVVKGKADAYRPDQRGWVKAKTRETMEALVGAVVGSLDAPRRLVLSRVAKDGVLHVAGSTGELIPTHPQPHDQVHRWIRATNRADRSRVSGGSGVPAVG